MKVLFVMHFLLLSLPSAASSEWVTIEKNSSNYVFLIDSSSHQKSGDSITFWQRVNYGERSPQGNLSHKAQYTINCRTREIILRYLMTYDDLNNNGRLTLSTVSNGLWKPIAPETSNWIKMKHVCK